MRITFKIDRNKHILSARLNPLLEDASNLSVVIAVCVNELGVEERVHHLNLILFYYTHFVIEVEHKVNDDIIEVSLRFQAR